MPRATAFAVFSGAVADDDHLIILDESETVGRVDKRIAIDHARKQLVRAITSSGDPTVDDDDTEGFVAGNFWLNTTDGGLFRLVDASTGAADWDEFGTGVSAFTGLSDAPSDYSGQGGKLVAVNGGETALEFVDGPSGGGIPPADGLVIVVHGTNDSETRPTAGCVLWRGSADPTNATAGDMWDDSEDWD